MKKNFILLIATVVVVWGAGLFIGSRYLADFTDNQLLDSNIAHVSTDIRETINRAATTKDGYQRWIHFVNLTSGRNYYEITKGNSYPNGVPEITVNLTPGVKFLDPAAGMTKDVVFDKTTGLPITPVTVALGLAPVVQSAKEITISANGVGVTASVSILSTTSSTTMLTQNGSRVLISHNLDISIVNSDYTLTPTTWTDVKQGSGDIVYYSVNSLSQLTAGDVKTITGPDATLANVLTCGCGRCPGGPGAGPTCDADPCKGGCDNPSPCCGGNGIIASLSQNNSRVLVSHNTDIAIVMSDYTLRSTTWTGVKQGEGDTVYYSSLSLPLLKASDVKNIVSGPDANLNLLTCGCGRCPGGPGGGPVCDADPCKSGCDNPAPCCGGRGVSNVIQ